MLTLCRVGTADYAYDWQNYMQAMQNYIIQHGPYRFMPSLPHVGPGPDLWNEVGESASDNTNPDAPP